MDIPNLQTRRRTKKRSKSNHQHSYHLRSINVIDKADNFLSPQTPDTEEYLSMESFIDPILVKLQISAWSKSFFELPEQLELPLRKKIMVLDLDETLIHATMDGPIAGLGWTSVEIDVEGFPCLYTVRKRPFVDQFLKRVTRWYDVIIYTASVASYASPVIDWLDPTDRFRNRLYRDSCVLKSHSMGIKFIKDLNLISNDLSSIFIIDNSPSSYILHPENGIHIDTWTNDPDDTSLIDMLPFLDALRFTNDVRSIISFKRFNKYLK